MVIQVKHFNDKYVLQLPKSSKSSKEISVLLNITKRYVNKLKQKLKLEGNSCLINKNNGKQRKWKANKKRNGMETLSECFIILFS